MQKLSTVRATFIVSLSLSCHVHLKYGQRKRKLEITIRVHLKLHGHRVNCLMFPKTQFPCLNYQTHNINQNGPESCNSEKTTEY